MVVTNPLPVCLDVSLSYFIPLNFETLKAQFYSILIFYIISTTYEMKTHSTSQGTKWALAHSHLRVGEAPGEYPSVCTGPYYRVPKKKKKKKKKNAISFI